MIPPHILGLKMGGNPANALNPIFGIVLLIIIHLNMKIALAEVNIS